jgi:hypothetical protein
MRQRWKVGTMMTARRHPDKNQDNKEKAEECFKKASQTA